MKKFKTFLDEESIFNPILNKNGFPDPLEASMNARKGKKFKPTAKQIDMLGKAFVKSEEATSTYRGSFASGRAQDLLGRLGELIQWANAMDNSDRRKVLAALNKYRNNSKKLAKHHDVPVGKVGFRDELPDDPSDAFA